MSFPSCTFKSPFTLANLGKHFPESILDVYIFIYTPRIFRVSSVLIVRLSTFKSYITMLRLSQYCLVFRLLNQADSVQIS